MKIYREKIKADRYAVNRKTKGKLPIKSAAVIPADPENAKDEMDTKKTSEPILPKEIDNEDVEEKPTCKGDTSAEAIKTNSTPRRKKDPLANLYSSLSPKYIGFSTPKSAVTSEAITPSSDEKSRFTRRKRQNNESAESFSKNTCSSDLLITSPDTISYVRRTNSANVLISPVSNCVASELVVPPHQRLFESPIEKLLRKNRSSDLGTTSVSPISVFEPQIPRPRKPIERKELMDIKVKVARVESIEKLQKHGISTFQLDQHDNVINVAKFSSEEKIILQNLDENLNNVVEPKRKLAKKTNQENGVCEENKLNTNPLEQTTTIDTDFLDKKANDEFNNDRIIPKDKPDESVLSNNIEDKVDDPIKSNEDCMEITSQDETTINISDNSVQIVNSEFEDKDEAQSELDNNSKKLSSKDLENEDEVEFNTEKYNVDDDKTINDTETIVEVAPTVETDANNVNATTNLEDSIQNVTANDEISNSMNVPESDLHFEKPQDMKSVSLSPEDSKNNEQINTDRYDEHNKSEEQCEPSVTKNDIIEENSKVNEPKTIDCTEDVNVINTIDVIVTNSMPAENNISVKSPSSMSLDSAKGSSVHNDILWMSFSPGDLFWGQIYSYCYWPCMVCPDPEGKTITSESAGRNSDVHIMVHVRFFADNARRNWVKRDNLLAFVSLENYQAKMFEAGEKYGKKHSRYKAFVVSKGKAKVWHKAVEEANIIMKTQQNDRLEKFYEIYENSKALYQLSRKRRQSMFVKLGSTSDIGSLYDSTDNLSTKQTFNGSKRDRSISPFSPAYSPVSIKSVKRRKLSATEESQRAMSSNSFTPSQINNTHATEESESSLSTSSQQQEEIFNTFEFKKFMKEMKDFVMGQNNDEKLERSLVIAVRNIWALRHINKCQMKTKLLESFNEHDLGSSSVAYDDPNYNSSLKRHSNRIRNISFRQSLTRSVTPQPAITYSLTYDKEKIVKPINRPIAEVIDDIFNLDNKYLFKGLGRDPICKYCLKPGGQLLKCSKTCQSWLHAECNGKSYDEIHKKRPRQKPKTVVNSDLVKPTSTLDNSYTLHITADDIQQSNAKSSATAQSMNESFPENSTSSPQSTESCIVCQDCKTGAKHKCAVCKCCDNELKEELITCNVPHCLTTFHPSCCRYWPQAKITKSNNKIESFRCPSHVCHTCVSDDPKGKFQNISSSKITKCVQCPATFHTDSTCIPAGSQILSAAYIICPRHTIAKSDQKINVNWCFICVTGGQVVCCDTCPTAVHAACLNIPINSDEGYICEECETGRMPLYGEMVWAKFNQFRWWPAIILPPTEIPNNISRLAHNPSDFVVRFFGTHDHGWISRRRVYLYLEGDSTEPPKTNKSLDYTYQKGVEEAKRIWEIVKTKKLGQRLTEENKQKLHPQPYVKIKTNRVVPPLKLHIDLEKVNKCDCKRTDMNPCGPDSNCLNRVLYHECNPKLCPAGKLCQNQMFESRISPKLEVVYMKERGFGLICREPISAGTFVIEYVGEVINDAEFRQRLHQKSIDRDENFYFLSLEKDYIIDAGPKGNLARFMNHSCDPNCETQKWSVNGLDRVGLFAIEDIPENTELTFNYHWDDLLGNEKKTCFCGAIKCAGQIGGKFKEAKIVENVNLKKSKNNKTIKKKSLKRLQIKNHKGKQSQEKTFLKIKSKAKSIKLKTRKTEAASSNGEPAAHDEAVDEMPSTSTKAI